MATLPRTRKLIDDLKDQIGEASKKSFLGVLDGFESGRFGRDDAMMQLQLTTMGPAAGSDPAKMNEVIKCFEAESSGN